eukprot:CAMPEP_0203745294 /NCGR_PEP_ID=MMETSP0098-20131031/1079_1 /ASSEMBLY_ACC=CAM_ASM_000208 /TAXON_ID=96639 /ORGANISM=" , Strain NY0313808BC1" /LENGTH=924 /DNA_ID=CAMNT_0050633033 /DNA_START=458 /DNA_END=3229 /DNA_ORIENTATION=-
MDGCKHKYKLGKRRPSYTHPLFRELNDAFDYFSTVENARERRELWVSVATQTKSELDRGSFYFQCLNISKENVREADRVQIEKDIYRSGTMWDNVADRQLWLKKLKHALLAYAVHDQEHGYTQGMNLFASEFLYVTGSVEMTFYLLLYVCETSRIAPDYFTMDMKGLKRDMWVIQQLLRWYLPTLEAHFKACDLDVSYVYIGPLLSLFSNVFSCKQLARFYDVLLTNGLTTMFAAWLSFFKINEPFFMEQTDAGSMMDAINIALARWGNDDENPELGNTIQRSLLHWCMILNANRIEEFRRTAPMNWFDMDLIRKAAADLQINGIRRSKARIGSPKQFIKKFVPRNTAEEVRNDEPQSSTNLALVWIASNIRSPFQCDKVEENRLAAIEICRKYLTIGGYEDILSHQYSNGRRKSVSNPFSCSPLLPHIKSIGKQIRSESHPSTTSGPEESDDESFQRNSECFNNAPEVVDSWVAPESYSSTRALLEGLITCAEKLVLEAHAERMRVHPEQETREELLLGELVTKLQMARAEIPVFKYSDYMTEKLTEHVLEQQRLMESRKWRNRIRDAFRSRKSTRRERGSSTSSSTNLLASQGRTRSNSSSSQSSVSYSCLSLSQSHIVHANKETWRMQIVALLLILKLDSENKSIGLYGALDDEASEHIQALFRAIRDDLQACIDVTFFKTGHGVSETQMNKRVSGFTEELREQLQIWNCDDSAALYKHQWLNTRTRDITECSGGRFAYKKRHRSHQDMGVFDNEDCKQACEKPPGSYEKWRTNSAPLMKCDAEEMKELRHLPKITPEELRDNAPMPKLYLKALAHCQQDRALYWALRSNYHIVRELSQIVDLLPMLSSYTNVESLATLLHNTTYAMQVNLCDSSRIEYIMGQMNRFDVHALNENADIERVAGALLQDLEDQVHIVQTQTW